MTDLTDERLKVLADKRKHFATACMDMWDGEPVTSGEVVEMASALLSRPPTAAEAGVAEREVLYFASYCDKGNSACSDKRPCPICLGMSNVYRVHPDGRAEYVRELAPEWNIDPPSRASPPIETEGREISEALTVAQVEEIIVRTEPDVPASVDGSTIWVHRMAVALTAALNQERT